MTVADIRRAIDGLDDSTPVAVCGLPYSDDDMITLDSIRIDESSPAFPAFLAIRFRLESDELSIPSSLPRRRPAGWDSID
jgi:hypothetical protein